MIFDGFGLHATICVAITAKARANPIPPPINKGRYGSVCSCGRYIFVEDVNVDQLVLLAVVEVHTVFAHKIRL